MLGISRFNNNAGANQQQRNATQPQCNAVQSQHGLTQDSFINSKKQQPNFKGYMVAKKLVEPLKRTLKGMNELQFVRIDPDFGSEARIFNMYEGRLDKNGNPLNPRDQKRVNHNIRTALKIIGAKNSDWGEESGTLRD